jgi:hypothetical protein
MKTENKFELCKGKEGTKMLNSVCAVIWYSLSIE